MNTIERVVALTRDHGWIPLSAFAIGAAVWFLKGHTPLARVPAGYRPWLALTLGAVAGMLQVIITGATWTKALVDGLLAAVIAIAGHELVIESLRDGREFFAKPRGSEPPRDGEASP